MRIVKIDLVQIQEIYDNYLVNDFIVDEVKPFDEIKRMYLDNKYEGYHVDNFYGTHIIGPILVKNPCLMNHIVSKLLKRDLKAIDYPYEEDSYEVTLNALKERIK